MCVFSMRGCKYRCVCCVLREENDRLVQEQTDTEMYQNTASGKPLAHAREPPSVYTGPQLDWYGDA